MRSGVAKVAAIAVVGLVLAVTLGLVAHAVARDTVALSGEPLATPKPLAPPGADETAARQRTAAPPADTPTTTAETETETETETEADDGQGRGRGRGRGGDSDRSGSNSGSGSSNSGSGSGSSGSGSDDRDD